jgi:hypothetical protein
MAPTIVIYDDTPAQREVRELRFFADGAYLETRTLFDFDGERWNTYGPARVEWLELKDAHRAESAMLAEIAAAKLSRDAYASRGQMHVYV